MDTSGRQHRSFIKKGLLLPCIAQERGASLSSLTVSTFTFEGSWILSLEAKAGQSPLQKVLCLSYELLRQVCRLTGSPLPYGLSTEPPATAIWLHTWVSHSEMLIIELWVPVVFVMWVAHSK